MEEAIELYDKKYENLAATSMHIIKSLTYFEDAEDQDMPHMLKKLDWQEVKNYFNTEIKKIGNKFI